MSAAAIVVGGDRRRLAAIVHGGTTMSAVDPHGGDRAWIVRHRPSRRAHPVLALADPRRRGAAARRAAVPILMYHVISAALPGSRSEPVVDAQLFARQVAALRHAGYQAVTLRVCSMPGITGSAPASTGRAHVRRRPMHRTRRTRDRLLRAMRWPGVLNLAVHNVGPSASPSAGAQARCQWVGDRFRTR